MEKTDSWSLSVPKICHIYWGGGKLIYLRYLTVKSFMKHNPDWEIILWYPVKSYKGRSWGINQNYQYVNDNLCKDYLPELMELPILKIPVDFKAQGFRDTTAEIHKNDYIRNVALATYGGLWSDLDIIYFKSMNNLKVNVKVNKTKESYVCIGSYGHSTGFNMATEGAQFWDSLCDRMNECYHPRFYQCWGPDMMNRYYKNFESIPNAVNLSMDVVYAHNAHQAGELLKESKRRFNEESIGCHWYAGNEIWGEFLNKTGGGENNLPKCLITDLINEVHSNSSGL